MDRLALIVMLVAMSGTFCLRNARAEEETPSIKKIMKSLNQGDKSALSVLKKELKGNKPNWETVQKRSEEFVTLTEALGKNKPKKGKMDSWQDQCKDYQEDAKELNDAAQKKDKDATSAALTKLSNSCGGCHGAHK